MNFIYGLKILQPIFRKLHFFSLKGMNYNIVGSGEQNTLLFVLKNMSKKNPIFFDVGANEGQYAQLLLKHLPTEASVYSFEPSRSTFDLLSKNIRDVRITKINKGLSDRPEKTKLFRDEKNTTKASVFESNATVSGDIEDEMVEITTLDSFCSENEIDFIDFLKIDVEGLDLAVLKGAKKMLKQGNIKYIQFEFGGTQIAPRIFLKDFFELLQPQYSIYRILKDGHLRIDEYSEKLEIFSYANYFASRK